MASGHRCHQMLTSNAMASGHNIVNNTSGHPVDSNILHRRGPKIVATDPTPPRLSVVKEHLEYKHKTPIAETTMKKQELALKPKSPFFLSKTPVKTQLQLKKNIGQPSAVNKGNQGKEMLKLRPSSPPASASSGYASDYFDFSSEEITNPFGFDYSDHIRTHEESVCEYCYAYVAHTRLAQGRALPKKSDCGIWSDHTGQDSNGLITCPHLASRVGCVSPAPVLDDFQYLKPFF